MSIDHQLCPICGFDGTDRTYHADDTVNFICRRCGNFGLTGTAEAVARATEPEGRTVANLSGWIREHRGIKLGDREYKDLLTLPSPTVADRAMKLLQELAHKNPTAGKTFDFSFPDVGATDPNWIAATWSESIEEVRYLLVDYLRGAVGAID